MMSFDGLWHFHTGADPAWASPVFDDSQWPLLRSDKSAQAFGQEDNITVLTVSRSLAVAETRA
jgi:hypothetical protein